jgi:hypothetical protein
MGAEDTRMHLLVALRAPAVVVYFILSVAWGRSRLPRWARENELQILHYERRTFRVGPFFWRSRRSTIYFVHVRGLGGAERRGWVRFGPQFGILSDKSPEVIWEEAE